METMARSKYPYNDWDKPLDGFDEWIEKISEEAKVKFGIDADGDCPVDILFIDRTKYEPIHWWLVPYEHKAKTTEELDEVETAVANNLETALSKYQRFLMLKKNIRRRPART